MILKKEKERDIKMNKVAAEKMVDKLIRAHALMYCTETAEVQDGSRLANYFAKKKAIIEALTTQENSISCLS